MQTGMRTRPPLGDLRGDEPPSDHHQSLPLWRVLGEVDHDARRGAGGGGEELRDKSESLGALRGGKRHAYGDTPTMRRESE